MDNIITQMFATLHQMTVYQLFLFTTVFQLLLLGGALIVGRWVVRRYGHYAVAPEPDPLSRAEIMYTISTVCLNILVMIAGLLLWQSGILRVRFDVSIGRVILDLVIMFAVMDFLMYAFHRLAHKPLFYPFVHRTHHIYENPRPLTLFVLSPLEVLGFGIVWLVVIILHPFTWVSLVLYIGITVLIGLIGHTGVEPLAGLWIRFPWVRYVSAGSFHAEHHLDERYNFGFYTLFWDRLFGTISPDYVPAINDPANSSETKFFTDSK